MNKINGPNVFLRCSNIANCIYQLNEFYIILHFKYSANQLQKMMVGLKQICGLLFNYFNIWCKVSILLFHSALNMAQRHLSYWSWPVMSQSTLTVLPTTVPHALQFWAPFPCIGDDTLWSYQRLVLMYWVYCII